MHMTRKLLAIWSIEYLPRVWLMRYDHRAGASREANVDHKFYYQL